MSASAKTVYVNQTTVEGKSSTAQSETAGVSAERHYTIAEVAAMWNISKDAARRLFQNEAGVLVLANGTRFSKRRYRTLRIPQSVLERLHKQCSLVK